jgi:hypothetical protein
MHTRKKFMNACERFGLLVYSAAPSNGIEHTSGAASDCGDRRGNDDEDEADDNDEADDEADDDDGDNSDDGGRSSIDGSASEAR